MATVLERSTQELDTKPALAEQPTIIGGEMRVGLRLFDVWMIGVGSIIGSMAWLIHGSMIARAGVAASITAWILAAILSIPLTLVLMELSSMFPSAGGPYVYKYYALKRLVPRMGELLGFLTGWLFWICLIVGLACMANGLANLLCTTFFTEVNQAPIWFAPLVIVMLFSITTVLNLMQIGSAAKLNNVFSILKIVMALSFGAIVLMSPKASCLNLCIIPNNGNFFANVSSVLMLAMAGFSCIEMSGCTSSETADARKTVPKAVGLTLLTVTLIYIGMCVAIGCVPAATAATGTCPAVAKMLCGSAMGNLFAAGVVASIVGCGFTALLACARISYSMSKTGLFPKQFGVLDERTKVPKHALLFQLLCLCAIGVGGNLLARFGICPDAYTFLAETFGFLYAFLAMLYGICALTLRYTDPHLERPFRVGTAGNTLMWFMTIAIALAWGYAAFGSAQPIHQIAGAIILLCGVPIYFLYKKQ